MIMEYLELHHGHLNNSYKSIRDTLGKLLSNLINLAWYPSLTTIDEVVKNPSRLIPVKDAQIEKMMMFIIGELEKSRLEKNLCKYQNLSKAGNFYSNKV